MPRLRRDCGLAKMDDDESSIWIIDHWNIALRSTYAGNCVTGHSSWTGVSDLLARFAGGAKALALALGVAPGGGSSQDPTAAPHLLLACWFCGLSLPLPLAN